MEAPLSKMNLPSTVCLSVCPSDKQFSISRVALFLNGDGPNMAGSALSVFLRHVLQDSPDYMTPDNMTIALYYNLVVQKRNSF